MEDAPVEHYLLGRIAVEIRPSSKPNRVDVVCDDGTYRSTFDVSTYEAAHYRRLMNQRITRAFKDQHARDVAGGPDEREEP
jgi:hypothetical protein